MKQTKIRYQNLADGKIKIVAVENAATRVGIEKEFGEEVGRLYLGDGKFYHQTGDNTLVFVSSARNLVVGTVYSPQEFSDSIACMKEAAARLIEIRKQVAAYEVKEIAI